MAPADAECPCRQTDSPFLTQLTRRRSPTCSPQQPGMPACSPTDDTQHSTKQCNSSSSPGRRHTACSSSKGGCSSHTTQQPAQRQQHAAGCCGSDHGGCAHTHAHSHVEHAHAQAAASAVLLQHLSGDLVHTSSSGPVTTRIHAAAICCPMESRLIHSILDSVPGVMSVDVMVVTKMVAVHHNPAAISPAALVAALNSAGLQASLHKHSTGGGAANPAAGAAGLCSSSCCSGTALPTSSSWQEPHHLHQQRRGLRGLLAALRRNPSVPPLCVLASGLLLVVNLLLLLPGISVPHLLEKGLLSLIAAAVAVPPVLRKAWVGLKNRNLDMNSLVVVALFGAVGLGDWFEAGALVVLFTLAEWLEERCVQRAAGAMEDILSLQPEEALVIMQEPPRSTAAAAAGSKQQQQHAHHHHHEHDSSSGCCGHAAGSGGSDAAAAVPDTRTAEHSCGSHTCGNTHAKGSGAHSHAHNHAGQQQQKQQQESSACCHAHHQHGAKPPQQQQAANGHACCAGHDHGHEHKPHEHTAHSCGSGCGHDQQHHHAEDPQQQPDTNSTNSKSSLPLKAVPVAQLPVGVLVLVRPGDKVPVDGTIEAGSSVLDESMITGESKPVTKTHGDAVLAGTVNCGSMALRVRATAAASNSTVARLAALMEAAAASKSQHDMAVELFAKYYTPAIVLTALLVAAVGSAVQPAAWRHWTYLSLVVLVTGCPCALVISTPVATVAGLTRAAKRGVLIKGGRPLELLGNLTAASFDKSGTLTEGHFQLTRVHTFGGFSRQQALQVAAMLEQHSNHPIAHAILGAAAASGCMSAGGAAAAGSSHVTELVGKGLQGSWEGKAVAVGSWGFAQELVAAAQPAAAAAAGCGAAGCCTHDHHSHAHEHTPSHGHSHSQQREHTAIMAEAKKLLSGADTAGSTVVCLVVEHQLAALLLLSDRARSDALAAVQQLQQLGVRCVMMTGDTMGAAAHVASQLGLGLEDVCAELLPQEKLELLSTLRTRLAAARRRDQQQQYGGARRWLSSWFGRSAATRDSSSSGGSGGSYCSSCGEAADDCSCCAALGPDSSSSGGGNGMCRSGSWGMKGSSSSGMRIDATAGLRAAAGGMAKTQGIIVAHVGDGINDAPALAGADVGIAMGVAGAALAVDAADVALFSNNLTSLPFVVRLGRRASWVIAANTVFACSIKIAVLGAAAGGAASLWLSLLADVGSSLLVTLHALTLLRFEVGLDADSSPSSVLYSSRLSGIPLAGLAEAEQAEAGAGAGPPSSSAAGAGTAALQWLRQLVARLMPYDKLAVTTPGLSAAASRVPSSTHNITRQQQLAPAAQDSLLPNKASAAQELREMAIMACAGRVSTPEEDTARLLAASGHTCDHSHQHAADGGGQANGACWPGGCAGAGAGRGHAVPAAPAARFVIDSECC